MFTVVNRIAGNGRSFQRAIIRSIPGFKRGGVGDGGGGGEGVGVVAWEGEGGKGWGGGGFAFKIERVLNFSNHTLSQQASVASDTVVPPRIGSEYCYITT